MIKSAHLTGSVSRKAGGLFDAVARLVQSQHKQGMEVKVFGLRDKFTDTDQEAWNPVPVAAFRPLWPKMIGRSPKFLEALNSFAPDISHTHGLWLYPSVAAGNYSRKSNRPYLISPHGMLDAWALKNSRWKKLMAYCFFEREHLRGARCIRALCKSEAHSIRRLQLENDIAVIPNGIDLPEVENDETQKTKIGNPPWQTVIEPGRKVLLFLSRIHPKKGLVNLLKAWAKIWKPESGNRKPDEWVLAIAGWDQGGHEAELKRLCAELQIYFVDIREEKAESRKRKAENTNEFQISDVPPSVLFLGPQFNAAKEACYHHCDAFVLPSFSEGLPMVVLEAWANSKPVIMTPECNLPEGYLAGAAIKVETTEASIITGLNELRSMTVADRMAMGNRAHDLVVERFTWSRVAQQLQAVHLWILGGGAKPDCIVND